MRELFVTELIKNVLGPRGGIHEELDNAKHKPIVEYVCGILGPIKDLDENEEAETSLTETSNSNAMKDLNLAESRTPAIPNTLLDGKPLTFKAT